MRYRVSAGAPEPLGVTPDNLPDGEGVNVAVFSANATSVEFCLFDGPGDRELARIALPERSGDVWHGRIADVAIGARYGLRAHGPFAPRDGHRFNPAKLLLDPYAVAIDRAFRLHPSMFGYRRGDPDADLSRDDSDSGPHMPKAIVTAPDTGLRAPAPLVGWPDTVVYELHVRGFTRSHPAIAEPLRGRFAALGDPAAVAHLRRIGVTTVEVMPAAAWVEERHLADLGLRNAWGYNPVGWMTPDPTLAPGGWDEVTRAVAALAAAGIETIVDVVLNHSGEGDQLGPTLSLRGLDNASYYRLATDRRFYVDDTGVGHALAMDRPAVARLGMDTLRSWARRGGVHGFRFDLATTLGRRADGFDPAAPFLAMLEQDPELRDSKLIAESWDIGMGGYQVGQFPHRWGEWNDRFRDAVRQFWRGDDGKLSELATRLAGSDDIFAAKFRPSRGVNFITAHDGFTLADLVSYEAKHNEANGEGNRDGTDANWSWNNGAEGPSDDPAIRAARLRDQRALLANLMLARGTPMLAMGAELGHTQGGNNNAYAQDNATIWLDWTAADPDLPGFVGRLSALRRAHPALRDDRFLTGDARDETLLADVEWRRADGQPMRDPHWRSHQLLVAVFAADGDRVAVVANRADAGEVVVLPEPRDGMAWRLEIDSGTQAPATLLDGVTLPCPPRAVLAVAEVAAPARRRGGVESVLLDRLARAAGIAPEWWEIDGTRHPVSAATKQALLAAMRLPAGSGAEARESLAALADNHQRRALPHALVARTGEPLQVRLNDDRPVALVIEDPDGAQSTLRLDPDHATATAGCDGRVTRHWQVTLPPLSEGRYALWQDEQPETRCAITVAPPTCFLPAALAEGGRRFGLAAHLYSVRRDGDQGIGDFTTLGVLGRAAGREGAASLGLNPLHALFPDQRERASPYHPSDRRFLDPIYIDVQADGFGLDTPVPRALLEAHAQMLAALSAATLVDYAGVWTLKRAVLEAAFAAYREPASTTGFEEFLTYGGEPLRRFATFQAIAESRPSVEWQRWPADLREANTAQADPERVRFHQWLQFVADQQLAEAAKASADGGLSLGLYRDLAVGTAPDGAEAWAGAHELARGASVGAPPDPFSAAGQIWHLPPFDPWRLRESGFRPLAGLFGANMRHAGALRIDHVMGLARLFWVPDGAIGVDGAYVAYPLADMLGQLALESQRARCFVVGEDLGTVPEGLRETLAAADVLSYRVLWFEREGQGFIPPAQYPARAVACISTHDLPTLAGWRAGADIAERQALGFLDATTADAARAERRTEADELAAAIGGPPDAPAVHGFVAQAPSCLVLAQVDDLAGEAMAVNLPGTDHERPNWRRKVGTKVPELVENATARAILDRLRPGRTG
jgi:glycogen debranching enzyme GlgX/4-alpha-glucanotransferase